MEMIHYLSSILKKDGEILLRSSNTGHGEHENYGDPRGPTIGKKVLELIKENDLSLGLLSKKNIVRCIERK